MPPSAFMAFDGDTFTFIETIAWVRLPAFKFSRAAFLWVRPRHVNFHSLQLPHSLIPSIALSCQLHLTRMHRGRRLMPLSWLRKFEKLLSSSLLSKKLKIRIYKTVILPVVLYGCETWTLTLREEQRLRVFENKVLRKIFGAKRDEVTGEWRKLHNIELHTLYSSPDTNRNIKSRRLRWAEHVARTGEIRNALVLVRRPEEKITLGRPRRKWEDDIKMDLREVGYDCRDWINLAQDRDRWRAYMRAAMNLRKVRHIGSHVFQRFKSDARGYADRFAYRLACFTRAGLAHCTSYISDVCLSPTGDLGSIHKSDADRRSVPWTEYYVLHRDSHPQQVPLHSYMRRTTRQKMFIPVMWNTREIAMHSERACDLRDEDRLPARREKMGMKWNLQEEGHYGPLGQPPPCVVSRRSGIAME
ncbi:hypothetical protein ANN_12046 [Periplaneta americana]|uniref:Uncharacterized protein n=1 Tax=Periplaneta americana TaxID=6978 RepID=A0ABQ8T6R3_PERAM|nr:hypothetical protein ANN_12046 [Periplaneta americana]